ncbi:MAG: hypothetical protein EOO38_07820 [Cytophagaceae bacterium]|nr:MAG: hypothetical protein EOO38_07820 [Cytophagaceae bacterium]
MIEIIRRSGLVGSVILPRRWFVERTLAWLDQCQRVAKDWETSIAWSEAWIVVSSIRRMTRRIAKLELSVELSGVGASVEPRADQLNVLGL